MTLVKPSNNLIQIVLMRWINQAFKLGPKTWVRLIIKKQYDIQNIFSINEIKASKNYSRVMYGHSKWSPHTFKLDFESIQINFLTIGLQKHFFSRPLKYAIFEKFIFLFFLTDPNVEQIMTWNQAYLYVQKDAKQNFGTCEDSIWAQWARIRTWKNPRFWLWWCQMIVSYPNRTARWVLFHFWSYKKKILMS